MASSTSWKCQKCSAVRSDPEVDAGADCFRCRLATAIDVTGKASVYVKNGMYVVTAQTGEEASRDPLPLETISTNDPARMCQSCRRDRLGYPEAHYGLDCLYCRSFEMMEETGNRAELGFNGQVFTLSPPSQTPPPAAASEVSVAFLTDIIHELRHDISELKKGLSAVEMILVAIDHRLDRMERDGD